MVVLIYHHKSRSCNEISRKIWNFALHQNNFLNAAHLPGKQNVLAERESRVFNDRTEWMLPREVFNGLSKLWGLFETDLFASRLNKQVDDYISWKPDPEARANDAFSIVWGKHFYAFPNTFAEAFYKSYTKVCFFFSFLH